MAELFDPSAPADDNDAQRMDASRPLADRLRPQNVTEVVGQEHVLAADGIIGRMVESGRISSLILWGPPGCGKTTLARILAKHTDLHFEPMSAVFSGVADIKRVVESARHRRAMGRGTLLFVDEIHRFNKSQQDAFLPYVEDGTLVLVGATTENPSFELNAALLSRCQVVVLNRLDDEALEQLLLSAERDYGKPLPLTEPARTLLRRMADGDGRFILGMAEQVYQAGLDRVLDENALMKTVQKRAPLYDKSDEGHYNLISALHKSVRGSDPDAALYWFARMLDGGEDPRFIARRITRMAIEDIGLADPAAMGITLQAWDVYERLGSPEGELALAQALLYVATAPKSNAGYVAYKSAVGVAKRTGSLMPPKHILNAPTKMMREIGYGEGYAYDHDTAMGFSGQNYFPDTMPREKFYHPVERGFEREIQKRLAFFEKIRDRKSDSKDGE